MTVGPLQTQSTAQHTLRRLPGRSTAWEGAFVLNLFLLLATLLVLPACAQEARWKQLHVEVLTLYQQGRYAEATKVGEEALKVAEDTFGPDHHNVVISLNNLANLYNAQGKYAEAEWLAKRELAMREKEVGPDDSEVAITLSNLAGMYRGQGEYAEAESLYKRALAIQEKALGPDDSEVAITLTNMARLYQAQGEYAEAESLYKRALAIAEKALGPNHPVVGRVLENMARLHKETGRAGEAKRLGVKSPDVAGTGRATESKGGEVAPPERAPIKPQGVPLFAHAEPGSEVLTVLQPETVVTIEVSVAGPQGDWCYITEVGGKKKKRSGYVRCENLEWERSAVPGRPTATVRLKE